MRRKEETERQTRRHRDRDRESERQTGRYKERQGGKERDRERKQIKKIVLTVFEITSYKQHTTT